MVRPPPVFVIVVASHSVSQIAEDVATLRRVCPSAFLDSLQDLPAALLPAAVDREQSRGPFNPLTSPTTLDLWMTAADTAGVPLAHRLVICNASNMAWFQRWAAARGFPMTQLVNSGHATPYRLCPADRTDETTTRSPTTAAALRVATSQTVAAPNVACTICQAMRLIPDASSMATTSSSSSSSGLVIVTANGEAQANTGLVASLIADCAAASTRCSEATPPVAIKWCPSVALAIAGDYEQQLQALEGVAAAAANEVVASVNDVARLLSSSHRGASLCVSTAADAAPKPTKHLTAFLARLAQRAACSNGPPSVPSRVVVGVSRARVGLMGNPSDQFGGKSMAVTVKEFGSVVRLTAAPTIRFAANQLSDCMEYESPRDAAAFHALNGYGGANRLFQATLKRFYEECTLCNVSLPTGVGFTVEFETNVPRQVGLAGSSCIITAFLKALIHFYGIEGRLPPLHLPSLALSVEQVELGIHAGLMDRVSQTFSGLIAMDFAPEVTSALGGRGRYTRMPISSLPKLQLVFALDPRDSGRKHNDVKERFLRKDPTVLAAAKEWAGFVDRAIVALGRDDHDTFRDLMNANFDLRLSIYGAASLGTKNLRMVELARQHGAAAKFTGSGGAVLLCCGPSVDQDALNAAYNREGFVFVQLSTCEDEPLTALDDIVAAPA